MGEVVLLSAFIDEVTDACSVVEPGLKKTGFSNSSNPESSQRGGRPPNSEILDEWKFEKNALRSMNDETTVSDNIVIVE